MTTNPARRLKVLYVIGAVALVLLAATAMAMGGKMANVGPWAKGPAGHTMGPMNHGNQTNVTCDGQGQTQNVTHQSPNHGSGGNRTHQGYASCYGNWTHG